MCKYVICDWIHFKSCSLAIKNIFTNFCLVPLSKIFEWGLIILIYVHVFASAFSFCCSTLCHIFQKPCNFVHSAAFTAECLMTNKTAWGFYANVLAYYWTIQMTTTQRLVTLTLKARQKWKKKSIILTIFHFFLHENNSFGKTLLYGMCQKVSTIFSDMEDKLEQDVSKNNKQPSIISLYFAWALQKTRFKDISDSF